MQDEDFKQQGGESDQAAARRGRAQGGAEPGGGVEGPPGGGVEGPPVEGPLAGNVENPPTEAELTARISQRIAGRTAALRERREALRRRQAELLARSRERRERRAAGPLDLDQQAAFEPAPSADPGARAFPGAAVALAIGLFVGWLFGRR
ncbi:MAG TPA: hypothetical protein VEY90_10540 [Thermoleophilaceae bacterium]|jgi:ElaB/YqjD/DUF883 family membrane-anchored ribosome-binding protein|nr:hypothetical protein [Thermoleophilaceae bacterium]